MEKKTTNLKQPKQLPNPHMRDRKVRMKAFSRFKDTARKCFGKAKSTGFGDGKKIICSVCGKEVPNGVYKVDEGKWYCKDC